MQKLALILLSSILLLTSPALAAPICEGTTCTAQSAANTSGSYHVQAAVDACIAAEACTTVIIPAGTVTWDKVVVVNPTDKGMTVTGQSRTSPHITATSGTKLFYFNLVTGDSHLTKVKLTGNAADCDLS